MEFIPKKFLLKQHRFLPKDHPIQEIRRKQIRHYKFALPVFDREIFYDYYFMNWFCGFCDPFYFLKIKINKKKISFNFTTYHHQYKLLRWVRYNFNFGEVGYSSRYKKYFYLVKNYSHLKILVNILNGYQQFIRSLTQMYLWLKVFNIIKQRQKLSFIFPKLIFDDFFFTSYLMGLIDVVGRLRMTRIPDKEIFFKYKIRFFFYLDIPSSEIIFLEQFKNLFIQPHFIVRSSKTIRFILYNANDLGVIGNYLIRKKPFNRILKIKFLNWFAALQYLRIKDIVYRRRDRLLQLLFRYANYYYNPRKKKKVKYVYTYL
jgi:hypothetical protein